MLCFGCGDNRCVRDEREVNAGIGDEVDLEFSKVDIQGTIKAKRGSDRGYDYSQN